MYSLLIDTHDANITIVLYKDKTVYKKIQKESSRAHSIYVMPLIKQIIDEANIDKRDIKMIYVVNGPGSFTGVRIGVTIAKTWAFTQSIPLKEICALDIVAINTDSVDKIVGIKDPKGCYIARYQNNKLINYDYLSNSESKDLDIIYEDEIIVDYDKVFNYLEQIDPINPHSAKPIYIKKIGVEND